MDALVRKLAALSVLWSLCELLMPEGGQRRLVRMTVSALVMITLLTPLTELLAGGMPDAGNIPAMSVNAFDERDYASAALRSLANQAKSAAERFAERAGYNATATVFLRLDGSLHHVSLELTRRKDTVPLIDERETARRLAELFDTDEGNIQLTDGAMGE